MRWANARHVGTTVSSAPVIGRRPSPLQRMGELHRAPDPVVIGEREGGIAERRSRGGQLRRRRGAVEEGEGRVGVQLDVGGVTGAPSGPLPEPAPARCVAEDDQRRGRR